MERIKGILRRKSRGSGGEVREEISPISEMETSTRESDYLSENGSNTNTEVGNSPSTDNTRALMMDKIEQLTNEKYSMEMTMTDQRLRLNSVEEENLSLKSKCEDLENSLELQKRRFRWQQKFYEKRIQQFTGLPVTSATLLGENVDDEVMATDDFSSLRKVQSIDDLLECNAFYEETIKALVNVQETKSKELNDLKNFYEEKLRKISLDHEADLTEILESSNLQVQKLMADNEDLVRDLLSGCEGLFDELKVEFVKETKTNTQLQTTSGKNIIVQFKELPTPIKGIVVAGIAVISIATAGWASWGFIIWVWPRLIAFAEVLAANPETSLFYVMSFLNSVPFQSFMKSWEEGHSLAECLKEFANTEFITSAIRMAPDLLRQFKTFQSGRIKV